MAQATDQYIEYKKIGGSPSEMMEEYARLVNTALLENRMGMSPRWTELMEFEVRTFWLEEIAGEYFVGLHWHSIKFMSKEEFFNEERTID